MSNDPPDFRPPRAPSGLHWLPPVSLGAEPALHGDDYEPDALDSSPSERSRPEHERPEHGRVGAGISSELLLTAMVVLGVTLLVGSALYAAGALNAPSHHESPGSGSSGPGGSPGPAGH
ncbi:MAG: hypothetical protein RL033_7298 [Pseudomonadota bacterium]